MKSSPAFGVRGRWPLQRGHKPFAQRTVVSVESWAGVSGVGGNSTKLAAENGLPSVKTSARSQATMSWSYTVSM